MIDFVYINRAGGFPAPDVLVFQQAEGARPERAIAWKVIRRCAPGHTHPFTFSPTLEVCLGDEFGNFTPRLQAGCGAHFALRPLARGRELVRRADAAPGEIVVRNELARGALDVCVYRDAHLLARRCALAPGLTALLRLAPVLWFGVAAGARQGEPLGAAAQVSALTPLPLARLSSVRVALRGGGPEAFAFEFDEAARP
ncbi:hypothetical protein F2P45_12930 [Massilia sp. CCM 8733]|uniref:Uncharacterized protein n=1 Tax=Massilia mucilaginosa TaxID=2609282 RepID=A0ABX0NT86_9BURK|nr:hypothetical protein [Massilia mucilaginosa]NHZ89910.1 hypothetical protein [Massilia mucilaginosa]